MKKPDAEQVIIAVFMLALGTICVVFSYKIATMAPPKRSVYVDPNYTLVKRSGLTTMTWEDWTWLWPSEKRLYIEAALRVAEKDLAAEADSIEESETP